MSAADYTKGFTRMCMLLCIVVVLGWYLSASSSDDFVGNAWMLLMLPIIAVVYFLLKDRIANILLSEAKSEE